VLARRQQCIQEHPSVRRLIHMRTQHLGPQELQVGAKVEMHHQLSFAQVAEEINRLEVRLREAVPSARAVYIEPDVLRGEGQRLG
jgi:divalent metal cation (Fe/Co/Zn/Cd) transporter